MAKVRIGVTYLDEHLVENDYYSEDEKVVGQWYGQAAERLGIEGKAIEAGDEAFERLRENLHPITGEKLTPRTKDFREASFIEARQSLVAKWRYEGRQSEPSSTEVETHRLTMPPVPNRVAFYDFQCGALDHQLHAAGREMLYLAPTASAVKMLQREGFENAATVADYLTQAARRPWTSAVLVIDEAGLQSNRQGAEVLALAQKNRQRIVFVGDSRQHVSVEAGDFLRVLETHSKLESRELRNIRRQIVEDYRQAIVAMAEGKTALGMEQLDAMGWIHEEKADYMREAAKAWLARSENGAKADEVVCVAPTWEENFALSREIRDGLKASGQLGEAVNLDVVHSLKWTTEQKRRLAEFVEKNPDLIVTPTAQLPGLEQARSYRIEGIEDGGLLKLEGEHTLDAQRDSRRFDVGTLRQVEVAQGDQILIRMNDKARGLINGQVVTVESVRSDGAVLTQCGKEIPSRFRQFAHGYVVTSHKAQGRTARYVIVVAERLDGKAAYVGCSRGRESCDVYTVDKERLFAGLPFEGNRRAALDVLKEQRRATRQSLARPESVAERLKSAAKAAVRQMVQAGNRFRSHAVRARQWQNRTKPKAKSKAL